MPEFWVDYRNQNGMFQSESQMLLSGTPGTKQLYSLGQRFSELNSTTVVQGSSELLEGIVA